MGKQKVAEAAAKAETEGNMKVAIEVNKVVSAKKQANIDLNIAKESANKFIEAAKAESSAEVAKAEQDAIVIKKGATEKTAEAASAEAAVAVMKKSQDDEIKKEQDEAVAEKEKILADKKTVEKIGSEKVTAVKEAKKTEMKAALDKAEAELTQAKDE